MWAVRLLVLFPLSTVLARNYYFDSEARANGTGTSCTPFNSLASVPNLSLGASDSILLKRGSVFNEPLIVTASGSPGSPVTIGPYGDVRKPIPVIAARASDLNGILLNGTSHVTVQDLEVTNRGDYKTHKRGVYVFATDMGEVAGVTVRRLYVHDVQGANPKSTGGDSSTGKFANASGGIIIEASGNKTRTFFTNMVIENNFIRDVSREGIYTWSNWCQRPELTRWAGVCFGQWTPSTGLEIRGNTLLNLAGDGIVVKGNVGAVVSYNRLHTFNNNSATVNAGIWTANSDQGWFHHNIASGSLTADDGEGFDIDHTTNGTLMEYNISHNNRGGFLLLCPGNTRNFVFRYNLSINDRTRYIGVCDGFVSGEFYKNTIFSGEGVSPIFGMDYAGTAKLKAVNVSENIFLKSGAGTVSSKGSEIFHIRDNVVSGSIESLNAAIGTISKDPNFMAPGIRDPYAYLLQAYSSALDSAPALPGNTASTDFFGNPANAHQNYRFYSGGGESEPPTWVSDFDTQSGLSAWDCAGTVALVPDPAVDLGSSVRIDSGGSISRNFNASNSSYRFGALIQVNDATMGAASKDAPKLSLGSIVMSFTSLSKYDIGYWKSLQVTVNGESANATLDGAPVQVDAADDNGSDVVFDAGKQTLFVDDVYLFPL